MPVINFILPDGAAYLFGLFKQYFEREDLQPLTLREKVTRLYEEKKLYDPSSFYPLFSKEFAKEMVCEGYSELKKYDNEAYLYDEDCTSFHPEL